MRVGVVGIVFGFLAAACGSGDADSGNPTTSATVATVATSDAPLATGSPSDPADSSTTSSSGAATAAPDVAEPQSTTSLSVSTDSTPAPATTLRPRPEGDDAPDFSLALGQGGTFTLSVEQKPVYMVFWAEW